MFQRNKKQRSRLAQLSLLRIYQYTGNTRDESGCLSLAHTKNTRTEGSILKIERIRYLVWAKGVFEFCNVSKA